MTRIKSAVAQMIAGFDADPADSDFQRGYLAALKEVEKMLVSSNRIPPRLVRLRLNLATGGVFARRAKESKA